MAVGNSVTTNAHPGSIVAGANNNSQYNNCSVFGAGNTTYANNQTIVGTYSTSDADAYFIVGNGTSSNNKSNAFTVKKTGEIMANGATLDGNITINRTSLPRPQIQLIFNNNAGFTVNNNKLLLGQNNSAQQNYGSVAIGFDNVSTGGLGCMTLGKGLNNGVNSSLVIGEYNNADNDAYLVVGNGTSASAKSNAFVVKKTGNLSIAGDLTFTPTGGTQTTLTALLARIEALQQQVQQLLNN